ASMVAAFGGVSFRAIISATAPAGSTAAAPASAIPERGASDLRSSRPTSRASGGRRSGSGRDGRTAAGRSITAVISGFLSGDAGGGEWSGGQLGAQGLDARVGRAQVAH